MVITNSVPANGKIYIAFPYWNPSASGTAYPLESYILNTSSPTCLGLINVTSSVTCIFNTTTQTLTLTNPFNSIMLGGSNVSFEVLQFQNPISNGLISSFVVSTGDSGSGLIDSGDGTL